jgi:hypothetical protein
MSMIEDYEDLSPEEYLAENIDEATMEVVENLAFLGDGTTPRDVMISILALEAVLAQIKIYLLENEDEGYIQEPLPPCDCDACKAVDKRMH